AEEIIEKFEGATRNVPGKVGWIVAGIAVLMSLFALYGAVATLPAQVLRGGHLLLGLILIFLLYPARADAGGSWRKRIGWSDVILALLSVAAIGYMFSDFDKFLYRSAIPRVQDIAFGALLILLILEAVRRSVGWHLSALVLIFLIYGLVGFKGTFQFDLPAPFGHRGYDVERIVSHMYMGLEGIFGVPLDVSSSFIILFTIYGALLDLSGAGKFFVDLSFALMGRRPTGAGRTVTFASFLLGGPSGSGVATTVTLGSIAYPMLRKAGYDKENAGGLLSAGGIGAVLSPPVLGAASFIIAEFLKISYLQVIAMSLVPTLLYYIAIFLMIELDAHRFGIKEVKIETLPVRQLLFKYGYHLTSLFTIVIFMLGGFTAIMSVFWASIVAFALSFLNRALMLTPARLWKALETGAKQVLSVVSTTAAAGLIIGIFTLTGLGLKLSGIIVDAAGANLFLALIYTAIAVWVLGLALPITASYIIAAVMAAPALIKLGVPDYAAHMFIFYYALLSEVSPPVGLSPFAAAAITGGNPYKTMMMAWKYTLPAFVVPFMFTLAPEGVGLLLQGDLPNIIFATITAIVGITALTTGVGGWLLRKALWYERAVLVIAGILLVYPSTNLDLIGLVLFAVVVAYQYATRNVVPRATGA
ncbi:partial Sialic acid TRAP transporter permease protein SiaT, partial [Anaerolineae bacterium]